MAELNQENTVIDQAAAEPVPEAQVPEVPVSEASVPQGVAQQAAEGTAKSETAGPAQQAADSAAKPEQTVQQAVVSEQGSPDAVQPQPDLVDDVAAEIESLTAQIKNLTARRDELVRKKGSSEQQSGVDAFFEQIHQDERQASQPSQVRQEAQQTAAQAAQQTQQVQQTAAQPAVVAPQRQRASEASQQLVRANAAMQAQDAQSYSYYAGAMQTYGQQAQQQSRQNHTQQQAQRSGRFSQASVDAQLSSYGGEEAAVRGNAFNKARTAQGRYNTQYEAQQAKFAKRSERTANAHTKFVNQSQKMALASQKLNATLANPRSSDRKIQKAVKKYNKEAARTWKQDQKYLKAVQKQNRTVDKMTRLEGKIARQDQKMERAVYAEDYVGRYTVKGRAAQAGNAVKQAAGSVKEAVSNGVQGVRDRFSGARPVKQDSFEAQAGTAYQSGTQQTAGTAYRAQGTQTAQNAGTQQTAQNAQAQQASFPEHDSVASRAGTVARNGVGAAVATVTPVVENASEKVHNGATKVGDAMRSLGSSMKSAFTRVFGSSETGLAVVGTMEATGREAADKGVISDMAYGHTYDREDLRTVGELTAAHLEEQAALAQTPEEKKAVADVYMDTIGGVSRMAEGAKDQMSKTAEIDSQMDDLNTGLGRVCNAFTDPVMQSAVKMQEQYGLFDEQQLQQLKDMKIPGVAAFEEYQSGAAAGMSVEELTSRDIGISLADDKDAGVVQEEPAAEQPSVQGRQSFVPEGPSEAQAESFGPAVQPGAAAPDAAARGEDSAKPSRYEQAAAALAGVSGSGGASREDDLGLSMA